MSTSTPLERAKDLIMDWVIKDDNVTFSELELSFHDEGLTEEEQVNEKEVRLWEIWANDENLILWETTNLLLVKAWNELAENNQFDVKCIGNETSAIYAYGTVDFRLPPYPFATKKVMKRLEDPNHKPLEKKYWQPVLLCDPAKRKGKKEGGA